MPRNRRSKKLKKESKTHVTQDVAAVVSTAILPPLKVLAPIRVCMRFRTTNAISSAIAFTTAAMSELLSMSNGPTVSARRLFNNIKLLAVRIWASPVEPDVGAAAIATIGLEFSPSLIAGFGGAPRIPYAADSMSGSKMAHLDCRPRRSELASQWFSVQQGSYTLWNMSCPASTIFEVEFLATFVNGEGISASSFTSTLPAGTIGSANFHAAGATGIRSIGWTDLISP